LQSSIMFIWRLAATLGFICAINAMPLEKRLSGILNILNNSLSLFYM
jgi:hypothetical protein